MESREVEFEFTKADFIRGLWALYPRIPFLRMLLVFCALGILAVSAYTDPAEFVARILPLIALVVTICLALYGALFLVNLVLGFAMARRRGVFGWHRVTLTAQGIHEQSKVREQSHAWKEIPFAAQSRHYIFAQAGGFQVHMITKRAFPSQQAATAFWEALQQYRHGADS